MTGLLHHVMNKYDDTVDEFLRDADCTEEIIALSIIKRHMASIMNSKERKKKYFEKLKADPERLAAHREKEKARQKAVRNKERDLIRGKPDLLEKKRMEQNLRKKKQRELKRLAQADCDNLELGSYKRPQSLGKAVNKLKKVLPDSPSKKNAVIRKLITEFPGIVVVNSRRPNMAKKLTCADKQKVIDFYTRDDISYQAPGKRDTKSVKDPQNNKRINIQKRYMVLSIKEAYVQFVTETDMKQVSRTAFYELRPKYVERVCDTPHTVCVCKYHGNMNYMLEALKNYKILKDELVPNGRDIVKKIVCTIDNETCMYGLCTKCKNVNNLGSILLTEGHDINKEIVWKQWVEVEKKPKQVERKGTVSDILNEIATQMPAFKIHSYVKTVQSNEFEDRKNKDDPTLGVLQIDFAENFSLISQDEIQTAHWSHDQVTLFTACVWSGTATKSYCIVSDDLSHEKLSIKVFLYNLVREIMNDFPALRKLSIFSDGPSSQFKNKYTAHLLCSMQSYFGIDFDWLFFATSHGKGAVDAIGGSIKNRVWIKIKSRQRIVSNPFEFFQCATEELKGKTKILFIPKEEVQIYGEEMEKKWEKAKAIPEIRQSHYLMPYDCMSILVAKTAKSDMNKFSIVKEDKENPSSRNRLRYSDVYSETDSESSRCELLDDENNNLTSGEEEDEVATVGSWVGVIYDSQWYPGLVEEENVQDSKIKVSFMARSGKKFFWPSPSDVQYLNPSDVMCIIKVPPYPVSNRHYAIENLERYEQLFSKTQK